MPLRNCPLTLLLLILTHDVPDITNLMSPSPLILNPTVQVLRIRRATASNEAGGLCDQWWIRSPGTFLSNALCQNAPSP